MGGPNSGNRWRSSGATCEGNHRIDIKYLKKRGWLKSGYRYSLGWNIDGEPSGNINYTAHETYLVLDFRVRDYGEDEWTPVKQTVWIDNTRPNFGGLRQWLVCPRCRSRCRILYGGSRFYCRKCHRLKYQSQGEDSVQRAITRAQATRKRLGGDQSIDWPFPPRPKGMHWKTYYKLEVKDDDAVQRWDSMVTKFMSKL